MDVDKAIERFKNNHLGRFEEAKEIILNELELLKESVRDTTTGLIAAVSLLERGGKKAAPSDKMFAQMLKDYKASIERGRRAAFPELREKK